MSTRNPTHEVLSLDEDLKALGMEGFDLGMAGVLTEGKSDTVDEAKPKKGVNPFPDKGGKADKDKDEPTPQRSAAALFSPKKSPPT